MPIALFMHLQNVCIIHYAHVYGVCVVSTPQPVTINYITRDYLLLLMENRIGIANETIEM